MLQRRRLSDVSLTVSFHFFSWLEQQNSPPHKIMQPKSQPKKATSWKARFFHFFHPLFSLSLFNAVSPFLRRSSLGYMWDFKKRGGNVAGRFSETRGNVKKIEEEGGREGGCCGDGDRVWVCVCRARWEEEKHSQTSDEASRIRFLHFWDYRLKMATPVLHRKTWKSRRKIHDMTRRQKVIYDKNSIISDLRVSLQVKTLDICNWNRHQAGLSFDRKLA